VYLFSARQLLYLRTRAGLSREQLALAVRLSASAITLYENGYRTPAQPVLLRLAAALGVSPSELAEPEFTEVGQ
jgi:transcriptional regulator with XRE-family HTH domain